MSTFMKIPFQSFVVCLSVHVLLLLAGSQSQAQTVQLKQWEVSIDSGKTFKQVAVPSTVENSVNLSFDGVSLYRTTLPSIKLDEPQRLILHFAAVATRAKVFANQKLMAEHLGGWTPFQVDVTQAVRAAGESSKVEITVEVDEKVGHNTQGFLPVVTNHFSGIWQPVHASVVNSSYILKDWFTVQYQPNRQSLLIKLPFAGNVNNAEFTPIPTGDSRFQRRFELSEYETQGNRTWKPITVTGQVLKTDELQNELLALNGDKPAMFVGTIPLAELSLKQWSPSSPQLYALRCSLYEDGRLIDQAEAVFGIRDFQARQNQFTLNGNPISIRGVLNWGYSPPSLAPSIDKEWMKKEIQFAKDRGFNLMKFCLYIPPKDYLQLCDQMGMLAWIEYPTWHPKLDGPHLEELRREYAEFFSFDRGHPSVVLRSLTCETGSSADLKVIQSLYDQCKLMISGAVVEDDSSWISWNRIHDFYDDHPYGNNHTWRKTLGDLRSYMSARATKPLALGEAIAADTWIEPTEDAIQAAKTDIAHGPWPIEDNRRWVARMEQIASRSGRQFQPDLMYEQSLQYGQLMRKFQIEALHEELPNAGYVVSVIRDFPKASMGLIDRKNAPKLNAEHWSFQADQMLILKTDNDRRSFWGGERETLELIVKQLPALKQHIDLQLQLLDEVGQVVIDHKIQSQVTDSLTTLKFEIDLPRVDLPKRFTISAKCTEGQRPIANNSWPVWIFPSPGAFQGFAWNLHESARGLFDAEFLQPQLTASSPERIMLTRVLDETVLDMLERGSKVLLIPNGKNGSFQLASHWFLRGSVVALPKADENWTLPFECTLNGKSTRQNMLVELQHFDLAGQVIPNMDHFLDFVDPMIVLWDNHDMRETRTHALAFQCRIGKGQLLVTTLNHSGDTNAVGRWLLQQWVSSLLKPLDQPTQSDLDLLHRFRAELNRKQFSLANQAWKFKPDPEKTGVQQGWNKVDFNDGDWGKIRIDRHWEGQGHASLDNWAWYRTKIQIPQDWKSAKLYLNVNGIDDYADIYVKGKKVASVGDIENKQTAFEIRESFEISNLVGEDRTLDVAIAVYDWFGAGGIFRPITLSTEPTSNQRPILVEALSAGR